VSLRNYLLLCTGVAAAVALVVLFVPGASEAIEGIVLGFLSRNAR
jgi:hypothetical protein